MNALPDKTGMTLGPGPRQPQATRMPDSDSCWRGWSCLVVQPGRAAGTAVSAHGKSLWPRLLGARSLLVIGIGIDLSTTLSSIYLSSISWHLSTTISHLSTIYLRLFFYHLTFIYPSIRHVISMDVRVYVSVICHPAVYHVYPRVCGYHVHIHVCVSVFPSSMHLCLCVCLSVTSVYPSF